MEKFLLELEQNETLIDAALRQNITFFASCGGKGTCARCKVFCQDPALNQPTRMELKRLDKEELAKGLRLACQARNQGPATSVEIQIPLKNPG